MSGSTAGAHEALAYLAGLIGDGERAWVVGGAVRDALLGRPHPDLDLAVAGDARRLARALAAATGGFSFSLSDAWGAWRVSAADRTWQVDLTPLTAATIVQDLGRRDLTINAIAQPLAAALGGGQEDLIDPHGGVGDISARRLRAVGAQSFSADPLRILRLARLACELGFEIDADTAVLACERAAMLSQTAPERVFAELTRLLVTDAAVAGIRILGDLGAVAVVLPELEALHGVEQSRYHHLDVYEHTLAALQATIELERDPGEVFAAGDLPALRRVLDEPLANGLTRGQALRFGALLHDIAKPLTRALDASGRITFYGHDVRGATIAREILERLRTSDRLAGHVAALALNHLRLGFLVHERPLTRRAVFGYLQQTDPVGVDVTLLSVADRLATLGHNSERAVELHLGLARELIGDALCWRERRPAPPIRGDRLARALGIAPGPQLGSLLSALTEAAYAGEVNGEEQAIEYARGQLR